MESNQAVRRAFDELLDPVNRANPYAPAAELRRLGRVHPTSLGPDMVTGFADCAAVLSDPAWSHIGDGGMRHAVEESLEAARERELVKNTFVWLDPPEHTRLRGLVARAFTPRKVSQLRHRIGEIVHGLLDRAVSSGTIDAIDAVAVPLPLTVITELFGIPPSDRAFVRTHTCDLARGFDPDLLMSATERDRRRSSAIVLFGYFRKLLTERLRDPRADLLSSLAAVEVAGDVLSEPELLATCVAMLVAGYETSINQIGNGLQAMLLYPDQLTLLRSQPELVSSAVDELLRFDPPVQMTTRIARKTLVAAGKEFPTGAGLILLINSANRDPHMFTDPDQLDVTRFHRGAPQRPRHLSFGWGTHHCMGSALAVLEMEVLLQAILDRGLHLTLAGPHATGIICFSAASPPCRLGSPKSRKSDSSTSCVRRRVDLKVETAPQGSMRSTANSGERVAYL